MEDFDFDRHDHAEDGATKTLHSIAAGGQHLVIIARKRISELLTYLDDGDFREAAEAVSNIAAVVGPLAHAQTYVGVASDAQLVLARDLRVGMVISEVGELTDVDVSDCPAERCKGHVKMKIGEHELEYRGDVELYVEHGSVSGPPSSES